MKLHLIEVKFNIDDYRDIDSWEIFPMIYNRLKDAGVPMVPCLSYDKFLGSKGMLEESYEKETNCLIFTYYGS